MPNVQLTPQMQEFGEREVVTGAFDDLSDVVRAGMRKLMGERGAAAFYALKVNLEAQARQTEVGLAKHFDPRTFEPRTFR